MYCTRAFYVKLLGTRLEDGYPFQSNWKIFGTEHFLPALHTNVYKYVYRYQALKIFGNIFICMEDKELLVYLTNIDIKYIRVSTVYCTLLRTD